MARRARGNATVIVGPCLVTLSVHWLCRSRVLVDGGRDLRSLHTRTYRSQLGVVGQEPKLFAGTIFENITYGKPDATMEEVIEAAKKAHVHHFIMKLPQKVARLPFAGALCVDAAAGALTCSTTRTWGRRA